MRGLTAKITDTFRRIRERGSDGVWISLVPEEHAVRRAQELDSDPRELPLKGQTFAIKDNIDVAGLPTTAACPAFAYTPAKSAFVVERLIGAGAIPIGKTNLDQFATGLNGTRSPYGFPRNFYDPAYISGGSSSGSAVAVAAGLVDFALGTDTAGSGRVPAAFNNLVGFKPTRGSWSANGLVPACRTLDCISVFTKSLGEAEAIDKVVRGFDRGDPFSRRPAESAASRLRRIGVLADDEREFFEDGEYARLYSEAVKRAACRGWSVSEFDYGPFRETANLLYGGPWVAERYSAIKSLIESNPDAVHPTVRAVILSARTFSAVDAFESQYRLAALERESEETWESFDAILLPSAGTIYTVEQVLADPIRLNTNLGRYTNFMNLLDLCGLAVPAGFRSDKIPFGVTFFAPAWREDLLFRLAREFEGSS
ncbi:MAG TPA: allophanate hydrolase [Terrimicrobiaceae bacterium]